MTAHNPALEVKRFKSRGDGFHTWTEQEIAQFEVRWPIGTKPRLAMALMLFTAQRRSDVVKMGRQHIRGDLIAARQEKTDKRLLIPIHPELATILATAERGQMTLLVTERGAPFQRKRIRRVVPEAV